jgi:hypothetical protein
MVFTETLMIHDMPMHSEKRENPRINLEVQVKINRHISRFTVHAWMQDISDGGFKIRADFPLTPKASLKEGDEIYFETFEEFFCFRGRGEVKWTSSDGSLAGVEFDELDQENKDFLKSFLLCSKETGDLPRIPPFVGEDPPVEAVFQG